MKRMLKVMRFELGNYFGSKSFMVPTIILCILCVGIMFFPRVKDAISSGNDTQNETEDNDNDEVDKYVVYDPSGVMALDADNSLGGMLGGEIIMSTSVDEVKAKVESEEAEAGFVINSTSSFDYYIFNKGMMDSYSEIFKEYMSMLVKLEYCKANNLNQEEFFAIEYAPIEMNETVLGKDSTQNYWYCYILVILIFMLVIMYGVTIATSVANEKGNRSIEILVTSTSSISLLFGKVFAGTIAAVFQFGSVGACLIGSYSFNKEYWPDMLGMFLGIPGNVLLTFIIFGIGGFLFYAFAYGALGALVSKVEDLNKTAGTAQMVIMIVYFVVLMQLTNVDGIVIKVCSYLPISSYSAMFARVAMGNVAMWEIVLSAVLLYISVVGMGVLGGKIFRASTLRYGNPIKIKDALKSIKKDEQ